MKIYCLAIIVAITLAQQCPTYKCAKLNDTICATFSNSTQGVLVDTCPKGMICNLPINPLTPNGTINYWNLFSQNMSNLTCVNRQPPAPVYGKAPGDKCNQAAECYSSQCDLEMRACKPSS